MAKKRRLMKAAALLAVPAAMVALPNIVHAQVSVPSLPQDPQAPQKTGAELKLLTPKPGQSVENSAFPLDISFESRNESPVVKAELWVDGVKWASRSLETPQLKNILSFDVDASTLIPGNHRFVVKVFSADGVVSQTQVDLRVTGFDSSAPAGPEMKFKAIADGQKVSGVVELLIDAKPKGGVNPYVTIYIDKQFKTLKNYPPYNYMWDTTTVPNGYHIIEAMGYLDNANATTTRRMKVYVDNAGGATEAMKSVPDLDKKAQPVPVTAPATKITTETKPLVIPTPKAVVTETIKPEAITKASITAVKTATIDAPLVDIKTLANVALPTGAAVPVLPSVSSVRKANTVTTAAPRISVAAKKVEPVKAVVPPTKVTASAPTPAKPMTLVEQTMKPSVKTSKATPKAVVRPSAPSILEQMNLATEKQPLQVAFNGQQIAFDVQPRVEAGLPLAPFRQIFEHSGGQVMWVPETKVVRAVSADREVVIAVGKNTARVNGKNVTLDKAAFIDRGRTMVPMSFVGQALDVDIQYDPATGRVSITSKN
jgi:hypothetical protein